MKSIRGKFITYISSIGHHIISHISKFEVKILLVLWRNEKREISVRVDWTNGNSLGK